MFLPGADKTAFSELIDCISSESMMTLIRDKISALRFDKRHMHVKQWAGLGFCWGS